MKDKNCILCKYRNDEEKCTEMIYRDDFHCPTLSNIFYGKIINIPLIKQTYWVFEALKEKFYSVRHKIDVIYLKGKYPDWEDDEYNVGATKFIWGIKSYDDLSSSEANLYTMNDIEITYNRDTGLYYLGIETAYCFKNKQAEVDYLNELLWCFQDFMDKNGYDTKEGYRFFMSNPLGSYGAESISELFTQFRIFAKGFEAVYKENKNE